MDREEPALVGCATAAVGAGDAAPEVGMLLTELQARNVELAEALRRAEAANQAKASFLANISHELRTPLNVIIGFADLMRARIHGPLGAEQYDDYVANIETGGRQLLAIVNDILDLAKLSSGQMTLSEDSVDVFEAIAASCRLVRHQAEATGIELVVHTFCDRPELWADERKLKQMLLNLLSNALKFGSERGKVAVSLRIGALGELVIAIEDNGPGIEHGELQRVLEAFVQADATLGRAQNGAGLGLPLTKALIELHGGTLSIDSEVGRGTVAALVFPPERVIALARQLAAS
jgi:signal transduction histidine kinase